MEQREALEAARLAALQEAALGGFGDIDAGRFLDVGEGDLDEFVADLGREASTRARNSGR